MKKQTTQFVKLLAIAVLCTIGLNSCKAVPQPENNPKKRKVGIVDRYCIDGVEYLEFPSGGISVGHNTDGSVRQCENSPTDDP